MLQTHRHGTNLIELVVVISLQTILLAAGVGLIGRMLEAEQSGRLSLETLRSIDALAEDFRRDVHQAADVSFPADKGSIALNVGPERNVTYEKTGVRLTRVEREQNELRRTEAYRLPPSWQVGFVEIDEPRRVRLTLQDATSGSSANRRSIRFEAVLGRDTQEEKR